MIIKFLNGEPLAKPFDKLRVNGGCVEIITFPVRGELVEPQKKTFARGSGYML